MALTADQITAQNFKDFYQQILPYLGKGGGGGSMNYSTDEQVVGTWIDGKPLYQKTYQISQFPNTTDVKIDTGITYGQATVLQAEGICFNPNSGSAYPVPFVNGGQQTYYKYDVGLWIAVKDNKLHICINTGSDWSYANGYVTLRYTKTTD